MITLAKISKSDDVTWGMDPEDVLKERNTPHVATVGYGFEPEGSTTELAASGAAQASQLMDRTTLLNRALHATWPHEEDQTNVATETSDATSRVYASKDSLASEIASERQEEPIKQADTHVLDTYVGQIVSVESDWATVILEGEDGARFAGRRKASDFSELGLGCNDFFSCKTINTPEGVQVEIGPAVFQEVDTSLVDDMRRAMAELGPE